MLEDVFERITLKRKVEGTPPSPGMAAYEEHVAILEAVRDGDPERARELIALHVRNAKDTVLRRLRDLQSLR